jgi:outer membrane protein assembly factor BamA
MQRLLICSLILFGVGVAFGQEADSTATLKLNRVIIIGNKKTLDRIILRELTLKPGDSVKRFELDKILVRDKNKIYNLRIFHTVKPKVLELPDQNFDLLIEVEERWFSFPVPIFELSDRNFNEWWQNYDHKLNRVNYGLRLYQYNFRGRNETIRLTAQFGFSRKFDLTYRIPYINKKQNQGLTFDVNYSEPKNLAYKTEDHKLVFQSGRETLRKKFGTGVMYTYRKSFYETHNFTLNYDNGVIADTIQNLNPNYYPNGGKNQWFTSMSYSFISEHRDIIAYPLNGYQITAGIQRIGLGLGEPVSQTSISASLALHKDIGNKFYLSNFTAGYWSNPERQPYSLFFGQGYRRTFVRGYEIYVIEGPVWGLNKTTLKRKLFQRTYRLSAIPIEKFQHFPLAVYLKAYADFGYTKNYPYYQEQLRNTLFTNKFIAGAGIGLDFVTTYDGAMRLEYTVNKQGQHGFFFHIKKEF